MRELLSAEQIEAGVSRLARQINDTYGETPLTIVGVLTGSLILLADLIRQLHMPLRVGLVQARSYRGLATRPGALAISADLLPDLRGCRVLLVDDIFDTGHTLVGLIEQIDDLGPLSIRSAVLLRKQGRGEVVLQPNFVVFEIPDEFVVGYGMDYADHYRQLPYVAALDPGDLVAPEPGP